MVIQFSFSHSSHPLAEEEKVTYIIKVYYDTINTDYFLVKTNNIRVKIL